MIISQNRSKFKELRTEKESCANAVSEHNFKSRSESRPKRIMTKIQR